MCSAQGGAQLGALPRVRHFMRAMESLEPREPKYENFWDAQIVLDCLRAWGPWHALGVQQHQERLAGLLALYGMLRPSDLFNIKRSSIEFVGDRVTFRFHRTKEQTATRRAFVSIAAAPNDNVCAVQGLRLWLDVLRKESITGDTLWITTTQPRRQALARSTTATLLKKVLHAAGIDEQFTAHSFRGAGATAALDNGATVEQVMVHGRWRGVDTFHKYYNRSQARADLTSMIAGPRPRADVTQGSVGSQSRS